MNKCFFIITFSLFLFACNTPKNAERQAEESNQNNFVPDFEIADFGADEINGWNSESAQEERFQIIRQAIIDGDADKLATVTAFPIILEYPMRDINNKEELKQFFDILFDDSIKNNLRNSTISSWNPKGWRGWTLNDGEFLWTNEDGLLYLIPYKSKARNVYIQKMRTEEQLDLNESISWITHSCFLSLDSSFFFRLEKCDGVERLHIFTNSEFPYKKHSVYNGFLELEGSCLNEFYWYACEDSLIELEVNSPMCVDSNLLNYYVVFPNQNSLPDVLQGKTIPLQKAYWREVKTWWNMRDSREVQ